MLKELRTIQASPTADELQKLLDEAVDATRAKQEAIQAERYAKEELMYKLVANGWTDCLTVCTTKVRRRIYWETHK